MQELSAPRVGRRAAVYGAIAVVALLVLAAGVYLALFQPMPGNSTVSSHSTSRLCSGHGSVPSSPGGSSTSVATLPDWPTYHHDNMRTGSIGDSAPFRSPSPSWTFSVDGAVYAEPLAYRGSVIVVTENNSVYSISLSGATLNWCTNLGVPLPRSALACGNIDPVGVTGTPAIDPESSTLYVVAMLNDQGYRLFALDADTGAVKRSVPLNPPGFDYKVEQQRGALAVSNGLVYVPFGGFFGDCGNYHGWVIAYSTDGTGSLLNYQVPSVRAAGIWSPGGVVVNDQGDLFVATGNSASTVTFDYGSSVIKLTPSLTSADYFAPSNWALLNGGDTDLGSLAPAVLGNGLVFQAGKEGVGYLLNESNLGGIGGELYSASICGGAFGSAAFELPYIFVPCNDGLYSLSVSGPGETPKFTTAWAHTGFGAGPPIIADGAVWTVAFGNGTLFALDIADGHTLFRTNIGPVTHFTTPSAGGGFLVAAGLRTVYCFQYLP